MKERPILFSAPMVRALLDGTKTQTRRVVSWKDVAAGLNLGSIGLMTQRYESVDGPMWALLGRRGDGIWEHRCAPTRCPYGQPGDRLWVREAFAQWTGRELFTGRPWPITSFRAGRPWLRAPDDAPSSLPIDQWDRVWNDDDKPAEVPWRPSIHMPRAVSRITLEVTEVRVERLKAIDEADATAEGITDGGCLTCGESEPCGCADPQPSRVDAFAHLWMQINGSDSWHANPWVWVVEFRPIAPGAPGA